MKTITYAIDPNVGLVFSRCGSKMAIPVLDYDGMKPENKYDMLYHLEECWDTDLVGVWHRLVWTRKIPIEIKNRHRRYWGMKPLKKGAQQ